MPLVKINETELYFESMGQGPPILFMHGGMGHDLMTLKPWFAALAADFTLIFYDHRGNGRSSREIDYAKADHPLWIQDAEKLRAHLGFETIVLFGHSYGGFLAQQYALAFPDRVRKLILCSTAPAFDYPETILANALKRASSAQLEVLQKLQTQPVPDDGAWAYAWMTLLPMYFHVFRQGYGDTMREVSYSAAAYNTGNRCLATFNLVDRLREIRQPTLLLGGADDWITPAADGTERLARHIPNATTRLFPRSGHYPFMEENENFVETVRSWLAGQH